MKYCMFSDECKLRAKTGSLIIKGKKIIFYKCTSKKCSKCFYSQEKI